MRFYLFLAVVVFLLYFLGLGRMGLLGPDEPRYAQVAREMLQSGDYITPRLNGQPWFEKPPLYYWCAAVSFRLLGVNEVAARLPAAIAAVGLLLLICWVAAQLYPGETSRYTVLILACSLGWVGFAHAASMEMLFSGCTAAALAFLGLWLWRGREPDLYAFYGLLGIAVLAKGPTAMVVAGLALTAYCAVRRQPSLLWRVLRPGPLLLFGVVAMPWYVAVYRINGRTFLEEFIWKQHFARYLTAELAHPGPWWYYVPVLLGLVFPWTALLGLLVLELNDLGWRAFAKDHRRVYLAAWIVPAIVFFSISKGKLPGYILMVVPAVAIWTAHALCQASPRRVRVVLLVQAALLPIAFAAAGLAPVALGQGTRRAISAGSTPHFDTLLLGIGMAGAAVLALVAWRARRMAACYVTVAIMALGVARAIVLLAPAIDEAASARPLAREIQERHIPVDQISLDKWTRRHIEYGLDFYLARELPRDVPTRYVVNDDGVIEDRGQGKH